MKIKLPVGRTAGWQPGAPLVKEKMAESAERHRLKRAKSKAQSEFDTKARNREAWAARGVRQHDFDRGAWPKPAWAEGHVCHLNIDTKTGACGQGVGVPTAGAADGITDLAFLSRPIGCFQSKFVKWVNCEACLVRLDWWLSKGQILVHLVGKKKRDMQPTIEILTPLEYPR